MAQISHLTAKFRIIDGADQSGLESFDFTTITSRLHTIAVEKNLGKQMHDIKAELFLLIAAFNSSGTRTTRMRGGIVVQIENNTAPESYGEPVAILT